MDFSSKPAEVSETCSLGLAMLAPLRVGSRTENASSGKI